jgi:hypothetical protein
MPLFAAASARLHQKFLGLSIRLGIGASVGILAAISLPHIKNVMNA